MDGQGVRLQVADRGAGIPDYAATNGVRTLLFACPPGSGRRSSGLGLPFVQEVARLHDGRASLDARDGGGTVASFGCRCQCRASVRAADFTLASTSPQTLLTAAVHPAALSNEDGP